MENCCVKSYHFDEKIKKIMQKHNLNQSQLAKLLGIAQSQVSNWINCIFLPKYETLKQLKERLNLSFDELF
jgi:transcriptional regulator with XRE-family HTH domain